MVSIAQSLGLSFSIAKNGINVVAEEKGQESETHLQCYYPSTCC